MVHTLDGERASAERGYAMNLQTNVPAMPPRGEPLGWPFKDTNDKRAVYADLPYEQRMRTIGALARVQANMLGAH